VTERARVIIGADGVGSRVAAAVAPARYHEKPILQAGFYTYFTDLPVDGFEITIRPHRGWAALPTNDGLTLVVMGWPYGEHTRHKRNVEATFYETLELSPAFAERVRAATRVDRFHGSPVPNFFRKPYGPGWALVGDAGLVMDPITGQGIGNAFRDAEALIAALVDGRGTEAALAGYQRARDERVLPMWEFTTDLARFRPLPIEAQVLFGSLQGRRNEIDRLLSVMTGSEPLTDYMSGSNMRRIVGLKGLARIVAGKVRGSRAVRAAA
jgi:2-polyprenyl-6-methoxyphenol hydroxylase-like FAD-dependent oxidoreductase